MYTKEIIALISEGQYRLLGYRTTDSYHRQIFKSRII